jgi:purine-binding chemotaxis protein CheW
VTERSEQGAPLHIVFRVADVDYAVPASDVLQMETFEGATAVPGASPWIAGLVQVRGRVLPVIDLRVRFGHTPAPRTLDSRIVVVARGERTVGLLVDRAREIRSIAGEAAAPPEALRDATGGFIRGVLKDDQRLLMMIDLDQILGAEGHG